MAQGIDGALDDGHAFDLAALADALSRSAFGEFVACFDPLHPRRTNWNKYRDHAPAGLQPLVDLFLLNRPVEIGLLPDDIQSLLAAIVRLGLAAEHGQRIQMTQELVLLPVFGRWLLCQPPNPNPAFYFGDDSIGLLTRILPRAGGHCLDLCAGPGLLALHSAGIAGHVWAVESDPHSAELARFNSTLNRLSHRIDVLEGDLFEPVHGRRFDTIVANPPMLPYPEGLTRPSIGHGGSDGFRITRRILAEVPNALSEAGTAQLIGTCLSDGIAPLDVEQLQIVCKDRLSFTITILSHHRLNEAGPFLDALTATVAVISGKDEAIVRESYSAMLARAGASHLCNLFIHARHGKEQLRFIDLARWNRRGHWYLQN